jgi:3-deoxy-manno-octulosonate cytidylyltransferase (CMP-KDO synthetase)
MKFYVVIPARYESSRFPGKVLSLIHGKTMLEHVYDNAIKSKATDVFIATDSDIIMKTAKTFTDNVFLTSENNRNGTERVAELSKLFNWSEDSLVINLQADMPELSCENINFLAKSTDKSASVTTLYYPLSDLHLLLDKNTVKIHIYKNNISFYREIKSQKNGEIYRHIGIYAYYVKDLYLYKTYSPSKNELALSLEQCRFIDNKHKISAFCAVNDPGNSVDTIDNLNKIKGINN